MSVLKIGELYSVKEFFWLLYPTKEVAVGAARQAVSAPFGAWCRTPTMAYQDAKWLSEQYNCNVAVVEQNTCFVLLEQNNDYFKILDLNGKVGWIYCWEEYSRYFELVKE